jgi:formylmethanofuran dehydrogenase subunit B
VLQDIGLMLVSPGEVFRRADVILVVGDRPFEAWPELPSLLFPDRPDGGSSTAGRQVVALGGRAAKLKGESVATWLKATAAELPTVLAALRARSNDRPLARNFSRASEVESAASILKAAKFGVALWSPEEIGTLTIEMLTGLIKDLNAATRWSGLSVSSDGSAIVAAMASGWMTGLPLRVSFGRGRPEHDPWQHDAKRMVESGEADAVVWISAFGETLPDWLSDVPLIVVADAAGLTKGKTGISVSVGRPGRDQDGVLFDRTTGTLVEVAAKSRSALPSVADVLNRIASAVIPP